MQKILNLGGEKVDVKKRSNFFVKLGTLSGGERGSGLGEEEPAL